MPVDGPLKKRTAVRTRRYVQDHRYAGLTGSISQPVTEFTYNRKRQRPLPPPPSPLCDIPSGCFSLRAPDSHLFFPSHVALGRCILSAAAAGALAGVVSTFTEPSGWCAGAVLVAAGCAFGTSAAPSSWRIEVFLVVAGVV